MGEPAVVPLFSVEQMPGIAALVGADGKLIDANPAFHLLPERARAGSRPDGDNFPYSQETILEVGKRCAELGTDETFEMGERRGGCPVAWFRGTAMFVSSVGAEPTALVHCLSTLGEKIREDRLARLGKLMVDAQGIAHLGVWEWEPAFDVVTWSDELFRIYGETAESYHPSFRGYLEKVHPEDRDRVREAMHRALQKRQEFSHDERILRPDGSVRFLHTWGHPVLDEAGHIVRLVGVCQDITERMETLEALRNSETRYRLIVENAEEGIWLIDADNVTSFANRKMATMLGYEPSEMSGRNLLDFMDEEQREIARGNLKRRRDGVRENHDFVLRGKDGHKVWVAMAACPIYGVDGKYSGALAMVSDITDRRHDEILLATQRSIFELLVQGKDVKEVLDPLVHVMESLTEGVLGSILLLTPDGRHVRTASAPSLPEGYSRAIDGGEIGPRAGSCGTAAYRGTLVVVDDIETDPLWTDYRELALRFGLRACWSCPIKAGEKVLGTFALYSRGKRSPSERELKLVRDFSSAAALVLQHVRMRDSLAESEARFRLLAEAASEGVAIHERGRLLVANSVMASMLGYQPAELVGMDIRELAMPEYRDLLTEKMTPGYQVHYSGKARRKDGTELWAEVKGSDATFQGRPVRLAAIRDITEEKELEEARERLLAREKEARLSAEAAIRARDEFLAIASHELKTPLTPIKIELQLLRRYLNEAIPPDKARLVRMALDLGEEEIERLGRLVNDLLDVTRITAGHLLLRPETTDLVEIVRRVVARFARQCEREKCSVELDLPPSLSGTWDSARLEQVVTTLYTNAIKYGPAMPIRVSLRAAGDRVTLEIRDHGIGFSPASHKQLFERFGRAAPVENFGGLGLGLFIAKHVVAAHGGSITAESEPGQGARFKVELPRAAPGTQTV